MLNRIKKNNYLRNKYKLYGFTYLFRHLKYSVKKGDIIYFRIKNINCMN